VDPTDIVTQITLASQLEQEGFIAEAAQVYQDIIDNDTDGVFAASAQQALLALNIDNLDSPQPPPPATVAKVPNTVNSKFSEQLLALQQEVAQNPGDMVAQITLASAYESEGYVVEAAEVYRYIIANDQEQIFSASAAKALADLEAIAPASVSVEVMPEETPETTPKVETKKRTFLDHAAIGKQEEEFVPIANRLKNLPIAQKQFLGMLLSSLVTLTGVVGAGIGITTASGQRQLSEQARSELAVNGIQYNIKIDQMGFGFRGQSDNTAIIAAATTYKDTKKIPPELLVKVQDILKNEIKSRRIEYATLVGTDRRILANGNADRRGEIFDPHGLVSQVLQDPRQIKTTDLVSWEDLNKENPKFPIGTKKGDSALIRYTVTPVQGSNGSVVGVLVSGDVIFNAKLDIVEKTVSAFEGGYSAVYQINTDGSYSLASAFRSTEVQEKETGKTRKVIKTSLDAPDLLSLSDVSFLDQVLQNKDKTITTKQVVDGVTYVLAAKAIVDIDDKPIALLVRGTPVDTLNALLRNSFLLQATVGLCAVAVSAVLAGLLGRAISKPLKDLQETAEEFGQGNLQVRAVATAQDEIGRLAETFNRMAEDISVSTTAIAQQSDRNEQEAEFQRKERERLQEGVIRLLLQIEEARRGDLSIQAQVDEGEVGSIADAFNATLRSLRLLVSQVQTSANQVHDSAITNNDLITRLSDEATLQERAIQSAERSVQGIAQSIQSVAKSAQVAAKIARTSRVAAQQGQETMDETVANIDTIRATVADTSKKAKRLAESSQEISKIVSIISDISEKTNLLAFNASIEATRAGENGQGFRVVADEVRRLAEQVTSSAQEIEQLISGIQEETVQMMKMMEDSTSQVVTGTELVRKTKTTLQNVARISEEIDKVLSSISKATVSQRDASTKVTKTMQSVATVAQKTALESKQMSEQLKSLTQVAIALQESSSKFKVD
jgi:twitching motility protein PilJ